MVQIQNKESGDITEVGSLEKLQESNPGYLEGLERSGWSLYDPNAGAASNPTVSNTSPVSSTEGIRSNITGVQNAASNLNMDIDGFDYNAGLDDLKAQLNKIGGAYSNEEQSQIDSAAASAGAEYDVLIREAQEAKRKGMPKAMIKAGERGGFMSSQFAGAAALAPTEGGTFVGAGGELENIQSAYDANIQKMQAAKIQGIEKAREAARIAIKTGRQDAYDAAKEFYNTAVQAHQMAIDEQNTKLTMMSKAQQLQQSQYQFDKDRINDLASSGLPMTADIKAQFDSVYGEGFSDQLYAISQNASKIDSEAAAISQMKDIVGILSKFPQGEEVPIGDKIYSGIGENKNIKTFSEKDDYGNVTYIDWDTQAHEIVGTASGGKIGTTKSTGGGGGNNETKFTSNELKKLEQVGLSDADRQDQLDFLYGTKSEAAEALSRNNSSAESPSAIDAIDVSNFIAEDITAGENRDSTISSLIDIYDIDNELANRLYDINSQFTDLKQKSSYGF